LKKCLKKVTNELRGLGLDKDTLDALAASNSQQSQEFGFYYNLEGEGGESGHVRPRLTVLVHLRDGVAVDAQLSPGTRSFLTQLAVAEKHTNGQNPNDSRTASDPDSVALANQNDATNKVSDTTDAGPSLRRVEVPLVFDGQFFDLLQSDVAALDSLQRKEEQRLTDEIKALGKSMELMTRSPAEKSRKARADVGKWREIFSLYLDARVFFSTRESDHGVRTSAQALDQLRWFQDEVFKRKLPQTLKLTAGREAFRKFLEVNGLLLQSLKFQEINRLAVSKILKSKPQSPCDFPCPHVLTRRRVR
jgi:E3 ubiquitin-protein ligase BAH